MLFPMPALGAGIPIPPHFLTRKINTDVIDPPILIDIYGKIQHRITVTRRAIKHLVLGIDIVYVFPIRPLKPTGTGDDIDVSILVYIRYGHPFRNEFGGQCVLFESYRLASVLVWRRTSACHTK